MATETTETTRTWSTWGYLWVGGVVAVVLALVLGAFTDALTSDDADVDATSAGLVCEDFVRDQLRSPGSAEFGAPNVIGANGTYTVRGIVDSENGFGATLRADYSCSVSKSGATWNLAEPVRVTTR